VRKIRPLLLCLATACAAPPVAEIGQTVDPFEGEPALISTTPIAEIPLGKFLADIASSIQAWSQKTWASSNTSDFRKQSLLEHHITQMARERKEDLLYVLEAGPQHSRVIAAAALGFTRDQDVLSPLLDALDDSDPRLVGNALLGLTILEHPDTPTERIASILQYDQDPQLRWAAAYCARTLVERNIRSDQLTGAARSALHDSEPVVRAQCCLLLGLVGDDESFAAIETLIQDKVPLVSAAAIRGIGALGKSSVKLKGTCARALTKHLQAENSVMRKRVRVSLVQLAERDYGDNVELWRTWSSRLP
jgi:HEAT repeat protein